MALASLIAAFVWILVTDHVAYVPPGNTIDAYFLNTFKWMIFLKYLLAIVFILMMFMLPIMYGFKKESDRNKKIGFTITIVTILILGVLIALCIDNVRRVFWETPAVAEHVVQKKNYSGRTYTHTLYFEDGSFAHVSAYQYDKAALDDHVYVVCVADVAVGAFRTEEYSLAES